MTPAEVLGGASAALIALGIGVIIAGLKTRPANLGPAGDRIRRRPASLRWVIAGSCGAGALLVTGWPAFAVAVAGFVLTVPAMVRADARAAERIERAEAVEEWARRVADVLAIGVGLEQALVSAARTAPEPIAPAATTLSARIAAGTPTESALRRFADDLDDPSSDLVVAALILAVRRRGPGIATALTALAESVGEEVAARRRIEADRAKPRATARAVAIITVVVLVIGLLNREYTQPYTTAVGQIVLGATLACFAATLWWMHTMTIGHRPTRILASDQGGDP